MEEGTGLRLEEMQGWDGPYSLSEYVLQQVWARREYLAEGLRTADGRVVAVGNAGRWNRGPGPDFLGAVIFLDGVRHEGDIEVHLREREWAQHAHAHDPSYSGVILHVVLFPSRETRSIGWGGAAIPVLVLLPHLLRDLEDAAVDYALERALPTGFGLHGQARGPAEVEPWEAARWRAKRERARQRIEAWGWAEACHATALEVLGFSRHRLGMVNLARRYPLAMGPWPEERAALQIRLESVSGWGRCHGRPANHPLTRLGQYAGWLAHDLAWPEALARTRLDADGERAHGAQCRRVWVRWSAQTAQTLAGRKVPAGRWETWLLEGAIPLLAARGVWDDNDAFALWRSARPGEVDDRTWDAVWAWQREMHPARELSHGMVQAWRQWCAATSMREGETGALGLTSFPGGE